MCLKKKKKERKICIDQGKIEKIDFENRNPIISQRKK